MGGVTTAPFSGWPPEALAWFRELEGDNTRAWFHAHRATYDEAVRGPTSTFQHWCSPMPRRHSARRQCPVNNASAWRTDTFSPERDDPLGRHHEPVAGVTASGQLLVDAPGGALMVAQLAGAVWRQQLGWGRMVSLTRPVVRWPSR